MSLEGLEESSRLRLPDDCNPIGHPECPLPRTFQFGQDNIAGPNEILHTLPEWC